MRPGDSIHALCKELRRTASALKVTQLNKLDRSDRCLVEQRLRLVINELLYLQAVGQAGCSVVIEMYEHLGGTLPTSEA